MHICKNIYICIYIFKYIHKYMYIYTYIHVILYVYMRMSLLYESYRGWSKNRAPCSILVCISSRSQLKGENDHNPWNGRSTTYTTFRQTHL